MSLLDIHAHVITTDIVGAFKRMSQLDRRKVFRGLVRPTRMDQRQHHAAQRGPGAHWPPLAASTIKRNQYRRSVKGGRGGGRRGKRGKRKLAGASKLTLSRLLRRLPAAVLANVTGNSLVIKSRVRWAGVHQAGGRAGHGARIPQRQFLWISPWLLGHVRETFEKRLKATFTRGL